MSETIYALVGTMAIDNIAEGVFYIGRTNDVTRREAQHRAAAKNPQHTEHKYQHIRALLAAGGDFSLVPLTDETSERYVIWRVISEGIRLTNMKPGDEELYKRVKTATSGKDFDRQWAKLEADELAKREAAAREKSAELNAMGKQEVLLKLSIEDLWAGLSYEQAYAVNEQAAILTKRREFTGKSQKARAKQAADLLRRCVVEYYLKHDLDLPLRTR